MNIKSTLMGKVTVMMAYNFMGSDQVWSIEWEHIQLCT